MRTCVFSAGILAVMVLFSPLAIAVERHVPSEYTTIQAAIDASSNGDIVIIAQGTYTGAGNRDIDFLGKAITVRCTDPNNTDIVTSTVIDCAGSSSDPHRGFYFHSGEGPNSIVAGLTITNGYESWGGGIRCDGSSPIIYRCNIVGNQATVFGGGIATNGTTTISHCLILNNSSVDDGGGIYSEPSAYQTITNCIIVGNLCTGSYGNGGGISSRGANIVTHCTIVGNTTKVGQYTYCYGGGIFDETYGDTIKDCIIWGNNAAIGPQVYSVGNISYCDIQGGWSGEGNINADPCFVNYAAGDYHLLSNSPCRDAGDPLYVYDGNQTDIDDEPRKMGFHVDIGIDEFNDVLLEIPNIELSATQFQFFAVEGGTNPVSQVLGVSNNGGGTLNWQISEDCVWLSVSPSSGSSILETDDVNLIVDISGMSEGVYVCSLTVSDANASNNPQTADITLRIGDVDGQLNVPSEYPTIQTAIDMAMDGDVVIIAPGIYTGAGNRDIDFLGKAITVSSTNPQDPCIVAATVIDCQEIIGHRGFYFHSGEGANSVLDGITIKRGVVYNDSGGGIWCGVASPTIRNCVITGNVAYSFNGKPGGDSYGGGIFCSTNSSPLIANCTISNNIAEGGNGMSGGLYDPPGHGGRGYGGGIFSNSGVTVINCIINSNLARGGQGGTGGGIGAIGGRGSGGGICGSVAISHSIISNNTALGGLTTSQDTSIASAFGGGIYGNLNAHNCLIVNNTVYNENGVYGPIWGYWDGGGIYAYGSGVTISNCTVCDNNTGYPYDSDGGVHFEDGGTIINSILWGNTGDIDGGSASYCDIEDEYITGTGVIHSDPCFVSGPQGDYYLSQTAAGQSYDSPCVNAGSDTAINLGMNLSTTRTDEFFDIGIVDIGFHYYYYIGDPDLNGDAFVNFIDYAILASDWLQTPAPYEPNNGDIIKNGWVEIHDLALLAGDWLACLVNEATNPVPFNNAIDIDANIILSWTPGENAESQDIYFGTDFNEVKNANIDNPAVYMGNQDVTFWDTNNSAPSGLELNTMYYWRIDEIGPVCNSKGNMWSFTTFAQFPDQASNPTPGNETTGVNIATDLSWTAGDGATSHDVYFGATNPPPFCGNQTGTTYDTGAMDTNTTYYWRIDEKNGGGTTIGNTWNFKTELTYETKLTASDGAASDYFGYAVSISGNRCIIGAYSDDDMGSNSGSAYIYEWNGSNWTQQTKLTASDGAASDYFGYAVSISGDRCIVGAYQDDDKVSNSGSAYIYEWNGTNWIQQAKLTASDGASGDFFGLAVSISGARCIVGAPFDDDNGDESGSAYIYEWNGTNWTPQAKLTASDGAASDFFGYAVNISGDRCIVGAQGDDDKGSNSGSTYIFEWNGTNWTQQAKLTASDGADGDEFGRVVSISGDRCIAGAQSDDDKGTNSGSAYIFEWNGTNWTQKVKLTASDGASGDYFGCAVSIGGDRCIVGASGDDDKGAESGSSYIYEFGP